MLEINKNYVLDENQNAIGGEGLNRITNRLRVDKSYE